MERIRKHLSYANVAATMALLFATSGGAIAATGGFSSGGKLQACVNEEGTLKLLRAGKRCKKGQKAVAWNQEGPAGARGSTGPGGATGASGPRGTSGAPGAPGVTNVTTERIDVAIPGGTEREVIVELEGPRVLAACDVPPIAANAVALQAFSSPGLYWKGNGPVSTDLEGYQADTHAMNIDVLLTASGRVGHVRLYATHEGSSCRVEGILTIVN